HVHDLVNSTPEGEWRSFCVASDGSYGVPEGLISSFPVRSKGDGSWEIVQGLELDEFLTERLQATIAELDQERTLVSDLLN
ncbi:MAG: malate dehydrogenase, partial [Planctomycetota bacterium]|nr:malate dehydrogenase [Planctomycetota bacterium]